MSDQETFFRTNSLALLRPPYLDPETITENWKPPVLPIPGHIVVWSPRRDTQFGREFAFVRHLPHGIALILLLPDPAELSHLRQLIPSLEQLRLSAVYPLCVAAHPYGLLSLMREPISDFSARLWAYIHDRLTLQGHPISDELSRLLSLGREIRSISAASRKLFESRRTLGRHFEAAGIPVPSHWLQFSRLIHAAVLLQNDKRSVFRIAAEFGYPDGFTLSNQMKRLFDIRPSDVRELVGWEWIVECWLAAEVQRGAFDLSRFSALSLYA